MCTPLVYRVMHYTMDPGLTSNPSGYLPAVVTKVFGTRTVNVSIIPKGPTWRRHIDQLHPHSRVNEDTDPGEDPQPTSTNGVNEDADPGKELRLASTDRSQDAEG